MRATIARKLGLPLLMLAFSGAAALWTFSRYLERANATSALEHRLLAEQLQVFVDLASHKDAQDRLRLRERMEGFEQLLTVLEHGGALLGQRIAPAPPETLADIRHVRSRWEDAKLALERLAGGGEQESAESYLQLLQRLEGVGTAARQLVTSFETQRYTFQQQTLLALGALSLLDLGLMLAGVMIVFRHVVRPVRQIETVARRVQAGDFSHRVQVTTNDELATLGRSFNQMSAHVSQLLAMIEAERRSAQASEQRLREMIQDLDAIVWEADPETLQFSFVSQRAEALLGYPIEQWVQEPGFWVEHLYPEDRDWAVEFCRKAARQGQFEYRMVAADGRIVWVRDQVRLSVYGPVKRLRGLMMDITRTRAADLALERSEATNRALVNAIPDLMLRVRRDGTYMDFKASRNIPQFVEPATLIGRTIEQAMPPEVAAVAMECLERAFQTGEPQMHECVLPVAGEPRDFEARIVACGADEALVIIRDITTRKRAEKGVRAAEAELRRVMGSVSDCLWSVEVDGPGRGHYLYCSPVAEKISGRPADYYHALEDWLRTIHAADQRRVQEAVERLSTGECTREEQEYRVEWPDGGLRWVRSVVIRRCQGERVYLDGVDADVTTHKLADEAVRQANQALETIIDACPLPIYALDLGGNVTRWNSSAQRVFGWTEKEVLGRRLPFVPESEVEAFSAALQRGQHGETLAGWEATRRKKDGTPVDLGVWTAILRDASGAPSGFIGITVDLTERKLLEEQLRQAQKMEAVGRLAGGVAHDFNNLLTVITGYGYMLLDDLAGGVARGNVEEILRAVDRASALTNQMLAFSRRQIAQPRAVDLNALVTNMDKMLRRIIGEDIELVTGLSPELGKIKADAGQIEQVIVNLVVNSRDALPGGGRIAIETANVVLDEAYARVHLLARAGAYVSLGVSDNGVGMDAHAKAHLFEPFFTTKQQGKGTGLGLSTVYGIVKQSGGEITIASERGAGTQVTIYLPRIDEPAAAPEPLASNEGRAVGNETVLVVEDEAEVRHLVREVLQQHGYTILEAGHPDQALQICSEHEGLIHLLLTDMVMPRMNGRELAERAAWLRADMKVLFMSGYTEDPAVRDMDGAGATFLKKPFTPAALARKIREVLDKGEQG